MSQFQETEMWLKKILGILLLMAQYIYTITVFVVNNRKYFTANSKSYYIRTRKNKNLFQPQSNLCIYPKGPHYGGTKIYNNLPTQIKLLSSNFNHCKRALKDFLVTFILYFSRIFILQQELNLHVLYSTNVWNLYTVYYCTGFKNCYLLSLWCFIVLLNHDYTCFYLF
jgi:hypothetical protein